MEVGQGPNWGYSAKKKKATHIKNSYTQNEAQFAPCGTGAYILNVI
jgi:hypothetical protein